MRDNWCVGFTRDYTVGVWVGNFSGEPMWNVSGISGAAPVWLELMNYLQRNRSSATPLMPKGIVRARATFPPGIEPEREELFLAGTEPLSAHAAAPSVDSRLVPRIAYPPEGTIIAIDPDIPEDNQRIFFEAENTGVGSLRWRLNGELLPAGEEGRRWVPRPGRYELALIDGSAKRLDSVSFTVRGVAQSDRLR
jgi:penicillin-binding protein 1C